MNTEDEARTKWCPHARVAGDDPEFAAGFNRMVIAEDGPVIPAELNPQACRCIASDCMAWRWTPLKVTQEYLDAVRKVADATKDKPPFAKSIKAVNDDLGAHGLPDKPFRGRCGLAGEP